MVYLRHFEDCHRKDQQSLISNMSETTLVRLPDPSPQISQKDTTRICSNLCHFISNHSVYTCIRENVTFSDSTETSGADTDVSSSEEETESDSGEESDTGDDSDAKSDSDSPSEKEPVAKKVVPKVKKLVAKESSEDGESGNESSSEDESDTESNSESESDSEEEVVVKKVPFPFFLPLQDGSHVVNSLFLKQICSLSELKTLY